jgi:hypothetical protein
MKVSLERKTVKRNSKAQKKSRLRTPVSSKKKERKEVASNTESKVAGRI